MKQIEVFKKIGGIIAELSEQYEYLKTVTDNLNELELELFAANSHFLADHIEVLCKLNSQAQAEKRGAERTAKPEKIEKPVKPVFETQLHEPKYFEPVVQQMTPISEKAEEKEQPIKLFEPEIEKMPESAEEITTETAPVQNIPYENGTAAVKEPETIRHELVIDESMITDEDEEIENEPPVETKKKKQTPVEEKVIVVEEPQPVAKEPEVVVESVVVEVKEEVLTINQKMSAQAEKALNRTEQMSIKPIGDLKLAITLNDKLLYVKDLFNGYNLAYSEAIEILNRFTTFDEAARFLKTNYVTKNNWDGKPATVEKFYALLKRRYA